MQGIQAARVIGGAGTGKTTMMMEIAEKALERPETGGSPFAIGFSSFTRAARSEAAGRAAAAWGMSQGELESHGWFKTCHSVAYKQLGVTKAEVLGGGDENDRWISEALGSDVQCSVDEDDGGVALYIGDPVAAAALNYWSFARSMVVPLRQIVEADNSPDAPGADEVIKRIEMYEGAKRLDGRTDFTDMLCRFAGVRNDPKTGPELVTPEGLVPDEVVGWIFDEAQDASKLLDMACRRLLTGNSCKWAWVVGDPFQVLYSWAVAT
jgi:superfamily I DNA/RNA helicase